MGKPSRAASTNKKKNKGKKKPTTTMTTNGDTSAPDPTTQPANTSTTDYKTLGNKLFTAKQYAAAVQAYTQGLATADPASSTYPTLRTTLLNNRTMAYLKLETHYTEAQTDCDMLIRDLQVTESSKVWYRRATALWQRCQRDMTLDHAERTALLTEALGDLERSAALQDGGKPDAVSRNLRKHIESLLHVVRVAPPADANATATLPPPFSDQRQDILQLLQSHAARGRIQPQEAFVLIDWQWWCAWCTATGVHGIEQWLPGKAKAPSPRFSTLTPIDNSSLIAPSTPEWWWSGRTTTSQIMDANGDGDATNSSGEQTQQHQHPPVRLQSGLYRGFHYELLPREVYHALTVWYTERTTPLVVRTNDQAQLVLYPTIPPPTATTICWCGACGSPVTSKKRCQACQAVFYCDRSCQERHWKTAHRHACGKDSVPRHQRVGLHNLGNTCFMNAAVTALLHVTPITRTFLRGTYQVVRDNPLGSGGRLAQAFGQTVDALWNSSSAVTPGALKRAVAITQPRFAGYAQHDAQEFLSFLVDGLHEDLNTAAATANSNSSYSSDPPDGVTAWHGQCQRNASVLWQYVYGQFVSTCVCPRCDYTSVSFDAYNHVSLELPPPRLRGPVDVLLVRPGQRVEHVRVLQDGMVASSTTVGHVCDALRKMQVVERDEPVTVCDVDDEGSIVNAVPAQRRVAEYCNNRRPLTIYPGIDMSSTDTGAVLLVVHHVHCEGGTFGVPMLLMLSRKGAVLSDIHALLRKSLNHEAEWSSVAAIRWVNRDGSPLRAFAVDEKGEEGNPQDDENGDVGAKTYTNIIPNSDDALEEFMQNKSMFLNLEWSTSEQESTKLEWTKEHSSCREQPLEDQLDRPPTLQQCLATFTRPERLDANNMWYCSRCKDHVQALKTMGLWKLPNILILHLKRFKHSLRREKLDVLVDFPLEGLEVPQCDDGNDDQDDFVQQHDGPAIYDCFAVVNHYGRMGGGHYTSMCRQWNETNIDDQWWLFDDSTTRPVGQVVSPAAYVLFYRRRVFQ